MDHRMTAVERAFQLAWAGQVAVFSGNVNALKSEGYYVDQLEGPMLRRQLIDSIKTARARERLTNSPSPASE